jgi:hypothetical protein
VIASSSIPSSAFTAPITRRVCSSSDVSIATSRTVWCSSMRTIAISPIRLPCSAIAAASLASCPGWWNSRTRRLVSMLNFLTPAA